MRRTFITTGIIVAFAFIVLIVFDKLTSVKEKERIYEEAKKGIFEIIISASGELQSEKSLDIMGPSFGGTNG